MKKVLVLFLGLISFFVINAQEINTNVDSLMFQGVSDVVEVTYTNSFNGIQYYSGIAGYQFTIENYTDSLNFCYFQGSYDGVNYILIDTLTVLPDGNYNFSDENPNYLKYRIYAGAASGDTASIKNVIFYYKKVSK
jgi:hypothetical protein